MTDRQSAYSHGTREGHNVQSAFSPSLPVTPLTSRGGSPSHHRTLGTFTPVTYDMAARSFSTTNITRPGLNLATLPPLSSTMSYPISDAGLPMPNDSLHPRWDTSQPSMSFGLGNAQHQPSSSAVAPSDDLRLQHRSYSVDSGLQSQWAPGQSQPDCNDYYAPRLASYDVNGFGGHRPPLGLSSDFGNALPMASQDHQWQSAQPAPARAPAKRGRKKTDSKEQTFPFRLYE